MLLLKKNWSETSKVCPSGSDRFFRDSEFPYKYYPFRFPENNMDYKINIRYKEGVLLLSTPKNIQVYRSKKETPFA